MIVIKSDRYVLYSCASLFIGAALLSNANLLAMDRQGAQQTLMRNESDFDENDLMARQNLILKVILRLRDKNKSHDILPSRHLRDGIKFTSEYQQDQEMLFVDVKCHNQIFSRRTLDHVVEGASWGAGCAAAAHALANFSQGSSIQELGGCALVGGMLGGLGGFMSALMPTEMTIPIPYVTPRIEYVTDPNPRVETGFIGVVVVPEGTTLEMLEEAIGVELFKIPGISSHSNIHPNLMLRMAMEQMATSSSGSDSSDEYPLRPTFNSEITEVVVPRSPNSWLPLTGRGGATSSSFASTE